LIGDRAIGEMISEHRIAAIFFFKDPLSAHLHATNSASEIGLLMALRQFGSNWEIDYEQNSVLSKYQQVQSQVIDRVSA